MLGQAERVVGVNLLYNLQEAIQKARLGFDAWVLDPYCLNVIIHKEPAFRKRKMPITYIHSSP